jgi:hypothetical protein
MNARLCSFLACAAVLCAANANGAQNAQPASAAAATDPVSMEFTALAKQLAARKPADAAYQKQQARLATEVRHPQSLLRDNDRDPLDVVLRRTAALLIDIQTMPGGPALNSEAARLVELQKAADATAVGDAAARQSLFRQACALRRTIAFANPLLKFDKLLFLTHHRALYQHMCDQYHGFNGKPGGSLWVLSNPFSDKPEARDLLANATVENGRLRGRTLAGGSFISLELSYDAQTIYFAWTEAAHTVDKWTPQSSYHIFKVNADGSGLTQLTDGSYDDFDPCLLPDGRIAFVSLRRGGYLRCGGGRLNPTYTMFVMDRDGANIRNLSFHETHEWHPSVDNDGMIVYTRWDYVDRDSDIAHHLWLTYPDGRDPRSLHGNYPLERELRPWMEMSIRAVPHSTSYVAVSAPHHGQAYGSLVLIDPRVPDNNVMSQVKRLTPEVHFPESEIAPGVACAPKGKASGGEVYGTPWPLSEDYHLCVYDAEQKHYVLCLVDSFGNREVIYRDAAVPCLDPIPFRPRAKPPVIPARVPGKGEAATVTVVNVYNSDFAWPENTKIAALRIIQLFPKTTPDADKPNIGLGAQSLVRGVLGTVPVESDGSAYFTVPAGVPVYFQALDERGLAVQSMRSSTYLHPGEQMTCLGCHEHKHNAPGATPVSAARHDAAPAALRRAPSAIQPEADGSLPLAYPRLVQGVLDKHCVACHAKEPKASKLDGAAFGKHGWSKSFASLSRYAWAKHGGNGAVKNNDTARSVAGQVGARASKLFQLLEKGHYDVKLSPEELRRITLWLDCNSNFFGAYHDLEKQLKGEVVMPALK